MTRGVALFVLDLSDPFTADQLRAAYRQRAKTSHPDTGGPADLFRTITAARDYLAEHPEPVAAWTEPPPAAQAQRSAPVWETYAKPAPTKTAGAVEKDDPGTEAAVLIISALIVIGWVATTAPWLFLVPPVLGIWWLRRRRRKRRRWA